MLQNHVICRQFAPVSLFLEQPSGVFPGTTFTAAADLAI
jgi:hypothetical protein